MGWDQVVPVVKGSTEIFRDSAVLRENRERARLKFLFLRHGWTAERFQRELEQRIGFQLDSAVPEEPPNDVYRDHVGAHPLKRAGYYSVGMAVLRGRITAAQMKEVSFAGAEHRIADALGLYAGKFINQPGFEGKMKKETEKVRRAELKPLFEKDEKEGTLPD